MLSHIEKLTSNDKLFMRKFRSEPRRPFNRPIELCLESTTPDSSARATICDLSRSGLGLIISFSVDVGSRLHLAIGDEMRPAIVRRCRPVAAGYSLGLEFDESFFTDKALRTASTRHWLEIVS
jgi:hypothetical protein